MQNKDSSYVSTASGPLVRVFRRLLARLSKKPIVRHALNLPNFPHSISMEVHATTDIHISKEIAGNGIWEPDETRFIIDVLRRGDIFVDVGANIGYFTIIGSKMVGSEGKV